MNSHRADARVARFLAALRRRGWMLRVAESAGIGLLLAAAGAVAAVAVMYAKRPPTEVPVAVMLAAGAFSGGLVGLFRRPGILQIATTADRQLHLPELLSSAAMLPVERSRDEPDRALRQALALRASAVCHRTSAWRIRLRRFGPNAWAVIALSAAVPLLLSTLASPPNLALSWPAASAKGAATALLSNDDAPIVQLADSAAGSRMEMNPDEAIQGGSRTADPGTTSTKHPQSREANDAGHVGPNDPAGHGDDSTGGGNAHTDTNQPPPHTPIDPTSPPPARVTDAGSVAGGAGAPATPPRQSRPGDWAGGLGGAIDADRVPPWTTSAWPAETNAALRQVENGQIPAAYRDLVKAYFTSNPD